MELSQELVELCGIVLGDGHLHTSEARITITGSLEDFNYYKIYVCPLFETCFGKKPGIRKRKKQNAYSFYYQDKGKVMDFISFFNLKRGRKDNLRVPSVIMKNPAFYCSFLRGLFDTDGSLKFSKQTKGINYYPRVQITMKESYIVEQLKIIFKKLGFNFGFCRDGRYERLVYFQISGNKNLDRWHRLIGFSNSVHLTKYLVWKKLGFCPKSTLLERETILN